MPPMLNVILTYFKPNGKFYTIATHQTERLNDDGKPKGIAEVFKEVGDLLDANKRPGLFDGPRTYHVLVNVPDHPHDHPHLFPAAQGDPEGPQ